jgi:hypothetical protein
VAQLKKTQVIPISHVPIPKRFDEKHRDINITSFNISVLFQYVIYHAIFVPICDLPLATPHTASDVPPATP